MNRSDLEQNWSDSSNFQEIVSACIRTMAGIPTQGHQFIDGICWQEEVQSDFTGPIFGFYLSSTYAHAEEIWPMKSPCLLPLSEKVSFRLAFAIWMVHYKGLFTSWTMKSSLASLIELDSGPLWCRVEAPITNHLRDYVKNLEKYKAVYIFSMWEDRNQRGWKNFSNFIPWLKISVNILNSKVGPNIWPMSWVCHNRSF